MYNFYDEKKYIKLTKEEMENIFKKIQNGDMEARKFVIENNMRLLMLVAKQYYNETIELDDLINVGAVGLIKAVDSYDIEKNILFSTYASKCIQNEILMYLRKENKYINVLSLETKYVNKNEKEFTLHDLLSTSEDAVSEDYDKYEEYKALYQIIDSLKGREKEIVTLYFGFGHDRDYGQQEIADMLNLSQSYVSRLLKRTIEKIKKSPKTKELVLTLYN